MMVRYVCLFASGSGNLERLDLHPGISRKRWLWIPGPRVARPGMTAGKTKTPALLPEFCIL
jgi:hypothetical protein